MGPTAPYFELRAKLALASEHCVIYVWSVASGVDEARLSAEMDTSPQGRMGLRVRKNVGWHDSKAAIPC